MGGIRFTRPLIHKGKRISRDKIPGILENATWKAHDLVDFSAPLRNPPTWDTVMKLSRLAALDGTELRSHPHVLDDLRSQLRFVEILSLIDTTGVEPLSRLVPVLNAPINLTAAADEQVSAHNFEHWKPTSIAKESQGDFYVVKEGLHDESPN